MNVWDPADQIISESTFLTQIKELEVKFKSYEDHPDKIPKTVRNLKVAIAVSILVSLALMVTTSSQFVLIPIFIAAGAFGAYRMHIKKIQVDMANLLIARRSGWIYNPAEERGRWGYLAEKFPDIFQTGTHSQQIEDQFWGAVDVRGRMTDFWAGVFKFEVKHGKSSTTVRKTVIVMRAPEPAKHPLYIQSNVLFSPLFSLSLRAVPDTENVAFNKAFSVYAKRDEPSAEIEAVRLISPAVQERLLQLKQEHGPFSLLMQDDAIIFSFSKIFFKTKYTDFFKAVSLDQRDQDEIQGFLKSLFGSVGDMMRFLD